MQVKRSIQSFRPRSLVLAVLAVLTGLGPLTAAEAEHPAGSRLPEFRLSDQFGQRLESSELERRLILLIGGDRKGSDASQAWGALATQYLAARNATDPAIRLVRVADLRGLPRVLEPVVAKKLRRDRDVGILLDWRGELAGSYGFQPGVANVVLIDESGRIAHSFHGGAPEAQSREALLHALDAALAAATDSDRPAVSVDTGAGATTAGSDF